MHRFLLVLTALAACWCADKPVLTIDASNRPVPLAVGDQIKLPATAGGGFATTIAVPTGASYTVTLPAVTGTLAALNLAQTFTAQQQVQAAGAFIHRQASTQDGMGMQGRAGGSSSYAGTFTPTTLTASRTYTTPDADIVVAGSASALTSGRVPVATTGGLLTDNANFGWGTVTGISSTASTMAATLIVSDSGTTNAPSVIDARHITSGTPAAGFGQIMLFRGSTDSNTRTQFSIKPTWTDAGDGTRMSRCTFDMYDATTNRECIRMETNGSAAMVGFLGASAVVRPTSTTDLRTALINLGLYTTGGASPLNLNGGALTAASGTFTAAVTSSGTTSGIGYATGAGGTATQGTSRTNAVTLNRVCGEITLFSAAGSTSWQSFTVNNSAVGASDTIRVVQKSGTDLYLIHVTAVAAGSFQITFATTGGTTTEQPVFTFSVIKGVSS